MCLCCMAGGSNQVHRGWVSREGCRSDHQRPCGQCAPHDQSKAAAEAQGTAIAWPNFICCDYMHSFVHSSLALCIHSSRIPDGQACIVLYSPLGCCTVIPVSTPHCHWLLHCNGSVNTTISAVCPTQMERAMSLLLYCVSSYKLFDNAATGTTVLHTRQHVAVMLLHAFN